MDSSRFIQAVKNPFTESSDNESTLAAKLDSEEVQLSGGQCKKIGIIQAILAQPDLLIMDETFTGLDQNSLIKCQKALKKYLPNCLFLVVDHHIEDNNFDQFYDFEVNFANGLPSKKIPESR
ncbi:MAG: hypothetical protein S4CHLAM7_03500 [Chlamydiae bacterium]|nr:hypothetical protein [Chlamydiota bacterium]